MYTILLDDGNDLTMQILLLYAFLYRDIFMLYRTGAPRTRLSVIERRARWDGWFSKDALWSRPYANFLISGNSWPATDMNVHFLDAKLSSSLHRPKTRSSFPTTQRSHPFHPSRHLHVHSNSLTISLVSFYYMRRHIEHFACTFSRKALLLASTLAWRLPRDSWHLHICALHRLEWCRKGSNFCGCVVWWQKRSRTLDSGHRTTTQWAHAFSITLYKQTHGVQT